jgi:acetyl-CoA C-acetyltransferase
LLFANGGLATHSHSMVLGSAALGPNAFPQNFDFQSEADAIRGPLPTIEEDYIGPARIETYTVFYDREGSATQGVIVARSSHDSRFIAKVPGADSAAIHWLTSGEQEPVGAAGEGIKGTDGDTWWRAIPGRG